MIMDVAPKQSSHAHLNENDQVSVPTLNVAHYSANTFMFNHNLGEIRGILFKGGGNHPTPGTQASINIPVSIGIGLALRISIDLSRN